LQVHTVATTLRTLPRAAYVIGAILGALSFLSWLVVANASMPMAGMLDPSALLLFTVIWGIGMVAMMFPSLIPMVYTITVSARKKLEEDGGVGRFQQHAGSLPASMFILGYVAVWTIVGVVFYLAITLLAQAGFSVVGSLGFWAGLIIILTGVYQFTGFKSRALMKCRSPLSFIMMRWKNGNYGAAAMGVDYGTFCTKCCWVLMAGLLTVGAMSIPLMGVFSIIIFAEKVGPFGPAISKLVGAAFLATGILLIL
jgi:predicted metal-binding membrane protein